MSHARAVLIDLARARTIVDRALGHARANDFPPMTVTMLDTAGAPVAFARRRRIQLAAWAYRAGQGTRRPQHGRRQPKPGSPSGGPPRVHQLSGRPR